MRKSLLLFRKAFLPWIRRRAKGQTLVEYAMIIAVLALVTVGALYALSQQTGKLYSTIGSNLSQMGASH